MLIIRLVGGVVAGALASTLLALQLLLGIAIDGRVPLSFIPPMAIPVALGVGAALSPTIVRAARYPLIAVLMFGVASVILGAIAVSAVSILVDSMRLDAPPLTPASFAVGLYSITLLGILYYGLPMLVVCVAYGATWVITLRWLIRHLQLWENTVTTVAVAGISVASIIAVTWMAIASFRGAS